jgi:hypothetical protein
MAQRPVAIGLSLSEPVIIEEKTGHFQVSLLADNEVLAQRKLVLEGRISKLLPRHSPWTNTVKRGRTFSRTKAHVSYPTAR